MDQSDRVMLHVQVERRGGGGTGEGGKVLGFVIIESVPSMRVVLVVVMRDEG